MTIRALVEPPEPESTTLHAVTFTNTDAGSGVVVVRLVPETLILAEEATLQVLGLVPTRSREVGHTTARSVGFPAWVISTHPADTRQALRLVSDLEWARNTMPKVAKIEKKFATILADLGDSAPYFVPTLMEELAASSPLVANRPRRNAPSPRPANSNAHTICRWIRGGTGPRLPNSPPSASSVRLT